MSITKKMAVDRLDELHRSSGQMTYADYSLIRDGLDEIDTLRDRDQELEELWAQFEDVPINPDTECIEAPFLGWGIGVDRKEIWHWFDHRHSKGIAYLLYKDGIDRTDLIAKLVYLKQLCIECESRTCQFNRGGECRFALVHEREPRINDVDGCIDFDYQEGEA